MGLLGRTASACPLWAASRPSPGHAAAWCSGLPRPAFSSVGSAPPSSSARQVSGWPFIAQKNSGVSFPGISTLTSAPASISSFTTSVLPRCAAKCSGARPSWACRLTSAPASTRVRTTGRDSPPEPAAEWRTDQPPALSTLTSAPALSSSIAMSHWSARAAKKRAVRPSSAWELDSKGLASRMEFVTLACPLFTAQCSAVMPPSSWRVRRSTPASMRRSATSGQPTIAA